MLERAFPDNLAALYELVAYKDRRPRIAQVGRCNGFELPDKEALIPGDEQNLMVVQLCGETS